MNIYIYQHRVQLSYMCMNLKKKKKKTIRVHQIPNKNKIFKS